MRLSDLQKDGKIDKTKLLNKDGTIRQEVVDFIVQEKPIVESVTPERIRQLSVKENRDRYTEFPNRLPTYGLMPLPPDEHEHIGLYENKQNLYLIVAHAYNKIMQKLEELEDGSKNK